jgi:hypothetical protein
MVWPSDIPTIIKFLVCAQIKIIYKQLKIDSAESRRMYRYLCLSRSLINWRVLGYRFVGCLTTLYYLNFWFLAPRDKLWKNTTYYLCQFYLLLPFWTCFSNKISGSNIGEHVCDSLLGYCSVWSLSRPILTFQLQWWRKCAPLTRW